VDWKDAQPDADGRLDLRFLPTSTNGFLFGAEPAFPFALVDLDLVVLSEHVVDALAAGTDVTLGRGRIVVRHQAARAECR
jgi:hypothetical protein